MVSGSTKAHTGVNTKNILILSLSKIKIITKEKYKGYMTNLFSFKAMSSAPIKESKTMRSIAPSVINGTV